MSGAAFADRLHAVTSIAGIAAGQGSCARDEPLAAVAYPGVARRLSAIYWRSQETALRHSILDLMLWQVECDDVATFVARAAEEEPAATSLAEPARDNARPSPQSHAIDVLVALGARGQPTLQRLYAGGAVRDSLAKASLARLSRTGFRRP